MEHAVIRSEGRGRKRRRKDVQNALVDRQTKKRAVETRSKALVGRYVKKEFEGSGIFLGKITYYDSGLYRVDYEDGDCEDLESGEVREFLLGDDDFDNDLIARKKKLDELVSKKDVKAKEMLVVNAVESANTVDRVEASPLSELSNSGANEIDGIQADGDADSSSDSCEYARDRDFCSDVQVSLVLQPQLPPSSGNISVPEEFVSHFFSVFSFLRSFGIRLFLSPFTLDDFVGSLNCPVPNTLLDAIHVALMRALRRHLETLSSESSELASKCLRCIDWSLLDTLTWPVYLVQYLMVMGYAKGTEWRGFYIDVLESDYCTLSVGRKLIILQILCDDVLESAELREEIDMREESEVGIDPDAVIAVAPESKPKRVHPRYSKTSACKDQEAMEIIAESHETKSFCNSNSLGLKGTEPDADAEFDQDGNGDECRLCGMDGTLLCCDGCPSAYHSRCIGVSKIFIPEGAWYCPECTINKIGPTITKGTSLLRGAEVFGVDLYGQVFMGICNHLLVLKFFINSEPCLRYYNQNDIPTVLRALHSSVEHIASYSGICKGILQHWEIPKDVLSFLGRVDIGLNLANKKEDGECSSPSFTLLGKEGHKVPDVVEAENFTSCVTESSAENVAVSSLENCYKEPGFNNTSLDATRTDHSVQQRNSDATMKQVCSLMDTKFSEQIKVEPTMSASVSQYVGPSDLMHQSLADKSGVIDFTPCTSGNSNGSHRGHVNAMCVAPNMSSQGKEGNIRVSGRGDRNSADVCLYMGSLFKPHAYINHYVHGDFAASAAANLATISSEEKGVSVSHASNNPRKVMSANISLQVKAFSSAAIRFVWPNSEKKLVEVPRERCGWCLSCKAPVTSKRACLLNAAASNAVKGSVKILAGLRPMKNGEGSLPGIATYVMFMEESLCGLTVGPFLSATYRRQWRKQVEQATTCSAIKTLLLEFEENIRIIALSGDWVRLVDDWSVESSVTQSATCAVGSTQKRGPSGRRGRKQSTMSEVITDDCHDNLRDFMWWRGGMLSKLIFQKGLLPRSLVKKAACQGGSRKVPGLYYAEGSEVPKRSRQFVWRAAVEMSKNASQLALQVRYLDLHVRWSDLVRPEQNLQDGKGPETEASAFRNAFICDKKIVEGKITYGVAFGNQKHLPSRVMKNIIEVEQSQDGKDKYWFSEMRIPLYLIKEYEEKVEKTLLPLADKPMNLLSKLQRRQLKASRKDIFTYLSRKRDNLDKCSCASCQLDVLLGNAVKCSACQGYCHDQCTISSTVNMNEEVKFLITCKQCYQTKALSQNEKSNKSLTSPLLLQGQDIQNALTITRGAKQKVHNQPLASAGTLESSEIKPATHDSSLATKSQRKLCSWGLIWKKKNVDDTDIDFRLKNILLRGNPDMSWSGPVCYLCEKAYNSDLIYICCEACEDWYHAEAVELEESKINELLGFKCCRCRRIRSPVCPYTDPEKKKLLEGKKPRTRAARKQGNSGMDIDTGTISEPLKDGEPATPVLPMKEEVYIQEDDPLHFSLSTVEQFTEPSSEVDLKWNTPIASGSGPQKLPVRRHMKRESDVNGFSSNNPSHIELSAPLEANNLPNHTEESSSPLVEWDVSTNGFEDGMMFNYESLNYEDMEFEPQTYFSFTELLASDDDGQLDEVDASGDVSGNWENQCTLSWDGNTEQYGMGTSSDQPEPTISVEPAADILPCQKCSRTDPCPDLSCQICGLRIHSHCSSWVEQSSWGGSWRCGECRDCK
uniref:DDT domain-containing protein PTM n=1 Tax=Davidia involucrata TaxID=16924 RepID=A0A5B6ZD09_DAVIN